MSRKKKLLGVKSIETKHMEERDAVFRGLRGLDRRQFMKVSAAAAGAAAGLFNPHSFQPVTVAHADTKLQPAFRFAYISDSHLYDRTINDRFVNQLMRAVDDVNRMDPQPDFVFFGGDLAQLGQKQELEIGYQILKNLKAPLRAMVGEHDWYLDMGEKWRELFGPDRYVFENKGVHFIVLNSVVEKDFWTARKMTPMERMRTVAGLDNGWQSPFTVGDDGRTWLQKEVDKLPADSKVVVFSHSPIYTIYPQWNFWTQDGSEVMKILGKFKQAVIFHGHTHQMLTNRIGNLYFQGFLSTAWPWPYAPSGLPEMTIQMGRPDPFDSNDGVGDGSVNIYSDGLADLIYNLWNRDPVTISRTYMATNGKQERPTFPALRSY